MASAAAAATKPQPAGETETGAKAGRPSQSSPTRGPQGRAACSNAGLAGGHRTAPPTDPHQRKPQRTPGAVLKQLGAHPPVGRHARRGGQRPEGRADQTKNAPQARAGGATTPAARDGDQRTASGPPGAKHSAPRTAWERGQRRHSQVVPTNRSARPAGGQRRRAGRAGKTGAAPAGATTARRCAPPDAGQSQRRRGQKLGPERWPSGGHKQGPAPGRPEPNRGGSRHAQRTRGRGADKQRRTTSRDDPGGARGRGEGPGATADRPCEPGRSPEAGRHDRGQRRAVRGERPWAETPAQPRDSAPPRSSRGGRAH